MDKAIMTVIIEISRDGVHKYGVQGVRSCCAASRLAQHARQRVVDGRLLHLRPLPRSLPAAVSESPRPDHLSPPCCGDFRVRVRVRARARYFYAKASHRIPRRRGIPSAALRNCRCERLQFRRSTLEPAEAGCGSGMGESYQCQAFGP